jgi:hypothetical protein
MTIRRVVRFLLEAALDMGVSLFADTVGYGG